MASRYRDTPGTALRRREPLFPWAKILIVDDSPEATDAVATLLAQLGHDVRVAYDGRSALRQASEDPPKVVLLDIGMPEMDGIEVSRRMRQTHGSRVRIIAFTGYLEGPISEQLLAAHFDAILLKPAPFDAIVETIGRLIKA